MEKNFIQDIEENDGIDDAGTIGFGQEREEPIIAKGAYPVSGIKIDRVQFSVYEIKRRYDRGSICLDPDFQRNFVWKAKQKSELIESVIMGLPLPFIYLAETMEGKLVIIDGRQRLTTFFDYLDNRFAVGGLKIFPELNGYRFTDLEQDEKKSKFAADIEDFQLIIQIIKYPTPDRVRFDIFDRVNRGGTPLNNQEMRNALYQGKSTKLLCSLASGDDFKKATGYSVRSGRMKDRYIILRAISFYLWRKGRLTGRDGKLVRYRSDIEEFLGLGMEYLNRASDGEIQEIEKIFCEVMWLSHSILGEDAFRLPSESNWRRPVSMTLFESLFYFMILLLESEHDFGDEHVYDAVSEMLEDSIFLDSLTHNVDSAKHIEDRFQTVEVKCKEMEVRNQGE